MSSPRSIGGSVREGTRVVLREITASLHNSPPAPSSCFKNGNDSSLQKTAEHEVKVRFAREFADVGSIGYTVPESLSSSSSFQSLSSTVSTKSSSGICLDSAHQTPDQISDISYLNSSIPGVDELILGCGNIRLNSEEDSIDCIQDLSQDQTFASATDEPITELIEDLNNSSSLLADSCNDAQETSLYLTQNRTQDPQDRPILIIPLTQTEEPIENSDSCNGNDHVTANSQSCGFDNVEELPLPSHSAPLTQTEEPIEKSESCNGNDDLTAYSETCSLDNVKELPPPSHSILTQTEEPREKSNSCSGNDDLTVDSQSSNFDNVEELPLTSHSTEGSNLNITQCLSPGRVSPDAPRIEEEIVEDIQAQIVVEDIQAQIVVEDTQAQIVVEDIQAQIVDEDIQAPIAVEDIQAQVVIEDIQAQVVIEDIQAQTEFIAVNNVPCSITDSVTSVSPFTEHTEDLSLPSIPTLSSLQLTDSSRLCVNEVHEVSDIEHPPLPSSLPSVDDKAYYILKASVELTSNLSDTSTEVKEEFAKTDATDSLKETEDENEEKSSDDKLDTTLTFEDALLDPETVPEEEQYKDFKPQRQSTTLVLPSIEQPNFDELKSAAEEVSNDIFKSSFEFPEESGNFVTATSDIFQDPTSFDFLTACGNSKTINRLRTESLYVNFDPLVGDTISMLPQGNTEPINEEEQNGKTESPPPIIGTPKRNPAIAAIDRLLFFSPITTNMTPKMEEPKEKIEQPADEPKSDTPFINGVNMSKELELVRTTVLQLEEELEKQKKEHKTELERQKNSFQEEINQLQAQIAQEIKSKSQITVVIEEYEKSISRLLTEKTKLQEELQATNVHLSNTEAAFNDVHQKYEKVKAVVSVYKTNELVLRESIQENMDTIKCLQTRYDNLKVHATSQLEKANSDLENIRKQHEDEIVKLHALLRKAELKSNSLAQQVEQKTRENKELAQILDEVIARVGQQNAE
ncbi:transforming acidic coiled-coil protein isoform X1 [Megalopta genalis]|uniref:transforming acidic coiled-coil protein isoform X1 n=1 Tax=Megalopta genalis TaxID=115081 RepID=UPI003FD2F833